MKAIKAIKYKNKTIRILLYLSKFSSKLYISDHLARRCIQFNNNLFVWTKL